MASCGRKASGTLSLSIAFVTPHAIARLNRAHLGHAGRPTSSRLPSRRAGRHAPRTVVAGRRAHGTALVGDVYIAPAVARRNAARWHVGIREELARLVVHGCPARRRLRPRGGGGRTASQCGSVRKVWFAASAGVGARARETTGEGRKATNGGCGAPLERRDTARASRDAASARLLEEFAARQPAALARVISIVENHRAGFDGLLGALHERTGRARRIGITGPPGAGKSTLTDATRSELSRLRD